MAFTQTQVNDWFTANPGATQAQVAETVKGLGGLDANPELAGMIGQHYNTDATGVTNAYNTLVPPPAQSAVNSATTGATNFSTYTPDSMGIATTTPPVVTPPVVAPTFSPVQANVDKWKADNPTGTPQQIANAIAAAGGMTPAIAQAVANAYGTNVAEVNAAYGRLDPYAQMAQSYTNKDYSGINSLLGSSGLTSSQVQQHFGLTDEQMNQARGLGVNLNYTTPEIQRLVESSLSDKTLPPTLQINKILETGQKYGFGEPELEKLYGKDKVASALATYKTGINDYITKTLATDPTKTTFDEVGQIHQAAQKYGLTADEIAKYGGMDPATAKSYFDMYDKGLGSIVAGLNDPKVDDVSKTKTALALASKYGATDAELAKASNGKWTEKDVAAYLDPVRNVPTNLQKLFDDPNATAKDITKFITDAKADPRAAGIYGAALDKMTSNPELYLRDAINGKADVSDSYESFLSMAKATPEMATKYAPQIQAIENAKNIIGKHALNKDFGGEYKDFAMEMFMGLDKNTQTQAPKKLELTAPKTKTVTEYGEFGDKIEREVVVPSELKDSKGVEAIRDEDGNVTGYTKLLDAKAFDETWPGQKERFGVRANYDANGNLTGYESGARVHVSDPQYFQAKWDANGSPRPTQGANQGGGFFKGVMQDVASMGPIGTIALMAATGGLGSLAAGALTSSLGAAAAQAVGSGLVSGVMSEMGGGDFGKGFVGGAVGSGAGQLAGAYMPTNVTGNTFIDSYLTKAAPNVASNMARTGVMGGDMGDAGVASLLNTGINMGVDYGANKLLGETGMDKLGAMQPYATGVASNLVSSALTGKDPNVQNALMSTIMREAMSTGKQALKTAAKP